MSTSTRRNERMFTVKEILELIGDVDGTGPLPRRTWQEWRSKGTAPKCVRLPNRQLRIRQDEYERWLKTRAKDA